MVDIGTSGPLVGAGVYLVGYYSQVAIVFSR